MFVLTKDKLVHPTFLSSFLRLFQVNIRFVGYPSNNSTGDILTFATPNPKIDVKTSVFAKPQSPFIKKAHSVAIIHKVKQ